MKKTHPTPLDWFLAMLPYEIGLCFALFGQVTIGQVLFYGLVTHLVLIFLYFVFRYPLTAVLGLFFWNQ